MGTWWMWQPKAFISTILGLIDSLLAERDRQESKDFALLDSVGPMSENDI